ncbi:hypothetical protein OH492_24945 [Vibrio chagasii]|nr:hypothetical protein [Vibrio chagasii]
MTRALPSLEIENTLTSITDSNIEANGSTNACTLIHGNGHD